MLIRFCRDFKVIGGDISGCCLTPDFKDYNDFIFLSFVRILSDMELT